ncbi:hypothetical protein BKA56DRAFT_611042 [Ilyonectria sp. MPI-CAGE-AT-0026]|nr:hypothetical protein BKA56DRAFT_611042 [Ilyonectria sp. MPI-CAGE-AT-0026]
MLSQTRQHITDLSIRASTAWFRAISILFLPHTQDADKAIIKNNGKKCQIHAIICASLGKFNGHPWPSTRHKTADRRDERDKRHFQVIKKDCINHRDQWDRDIGKSDVGLAPENLPNFHVFLDPSGRPVVGSTGLFFENNAKLSGCVHLHLLQQAHYTIPLLDS